MKIIFTDNPFIHKKISANPVKKSFLTYQLYDWLIEKKHGTEDTYLTKQRIKKKIFKEEIKKYSTIEAYADPSNYRFINDLLFFAEKENKKLRIFTWKDFYENNLKESYNLNKEDNVIVNNSIILFEEYLKRGFLTRLLFEDLTILNLSRIEQFILLLAINYLNQEEKDKNCLIIKELTFDQHFIKNINNIYNLDSFININSKLKNIPVFKSIEQIIYNARKGNIDSPFLKNKISHVKEKSKIHKTLLEIEQTKQNFTCEIPNIFINNNMTNFINLPYFIHTNTNIPYVDIYKMLAFMEKNGFIKTSFYKDKNILYIELPPEYTFDKKFTEKYAKKFLNIENWRNFYNDENYKEHISKYFRSLYQGKKLEFKCPVCGKNKYIDKMDKFICANKNCNFQFYRIINPGGIRQKIIDRDFKKLIKYKKALIKNKIGGYNMYKLKKLYKNVYGAIPIIKDN